MTNAAAAFGGPDAGLPLDADGKWHGVVDDPGLRTGPVVNALSDFVLDYVTCRNVLGPTSGLRWRPGQVECGALVALTHGTPVRCPYCGGRVA